ncbi:LysR family transcriptional regulator [Cryobacterium sp. GrIS_2_6]|uniref:LysR family transcriptional regulator n=1 Tax=Cryobacterium sp. GrIS_2_6 TaxID=3162785 RepID=UPI002E0C8444|nr:DNA-binding transcriptional LysR family regulator [Cryobacterium psychrotolerans]
MHTINVDLNLLLPLRALLEERSVSRAAERMKMSQPSLSAALAKLRRHFGDELLQRNGNAYELTPLAVQLLERSYTATRSVDRVFAAQAEFDSSTSRREFSIYSSDYGMAMLGGALATVLGEASMGVRVRFESMSSSVVNSAPDSLREHDGMLLPHGYLTGTSSHLDLFEDKWVCVVAPTNSLVGETLSLNQLSDLPWVMSFAAQTEFTPAAKQMQMLGVDVRVEIGVPGFLAVPAVLEGTNRIALMQERLARRFEKTGQLRLLATPFDAVPFREAFWWNPVHDREPEHAWLRSALVAAVERTALTPAPAHRGV